MVPIRVISALASPRFAAPIIRRALTLLFVISIFCFHASAVTPQENVLYRFRGGTDGALPSGLVADKNGNLYGTTNVGGLESGLCQADDGCGTVFELKPPSRSGGAWTEIVIYEFLPFAHPLAGLIIDDLGNLYGTATYGGAYDNGMVFQLKPPAKPGDTWTENTLYSFLAGLDGAVPSANLVLDSKGNLYGTTEFGGGDSCMGSGGEQGCGTVYRLAPPGNGGNWTETVLYRFAPFNDYPMAGLILDSQGNLYGTTAGDQSASFGTVFKLSPPVQGGGWTETTLYFFGTSQQDGITPYAGLIFDKQGNLYGTTNQGGVRGTACPTGCGTVFELSPPGKGGAWTEKVLYAFVDGADGAYPYSGLIVDGAGDFYGTTFYGGMQGGNCEGIGGCGIVFALRPPASGGDWRETVLYRFVAGVDGQGPENTLIFDKRSLLGTTAHGGGTCAFLFTCGTVFQLLP
jgi:uncharacterized repeat protein (TIGR03803 family)